MRTMCVWFREWSLGRSDAPSDQACLVVSERPPHEVVAASPSAGAAGVELGMHRRAAEAMCPEAKVLVRDREEEARRFEPVVVGLEDLIPRVEVVVPGLVMMPLAGATTYYGAEAAVVEMVSGKLTAHQSRFVSSARVGVADGPFAAEWAARAAQPDEPTVVTDTPAFLESLDIASLSGASSSRKGMEELIATFQWLGVGTLGALADLPRAAIASRFGAPGLSMHRLASGNDRSLDPRPVPVDLAIEMDFVDEPLESADQVAFVARAMAARLIPALEGVSPHRMTIEITSGDGTVRRRIWSSPDPFDEQSLTDRVRWQVRAWLEQGAVPGGVVRLRLDPSDLSDTGRQLGLFEDVAAMDEAHRSLARAQAILGPDAVVQGARRGGRLPGDQVAWSRWGDERESGDGTDAPWPGATPAPSPALVPPRPQPIEIEWESGHPVRLRLGSRWEPILNWSGPWRMTGRWWEGKAASDRYQVVTSAGAFLCAVVEGRGYLVGVYD